MTVSISPHRVSSSSTTSKALAATVAMSSAHALQVWPHLVGVLLNEVVEQHRAIWPLCH